MSNELQLRLEQAEQRVRGIPAKYEKHASKLKWLGFAGLCVLVSPFVIAGIFGLIGTLAFLAIAFVASQFWPVFAKRISNAAKEAELAEANRHLAALKAEARRNPVETLQNIYREKEQALGVVNQKIHKFATKVNEYGQKSQTMRERFPKDAAAFEQIHRDMMALLDKRRKKWQESKQKLEQFWGEIERADAIWQMSMATAELREAAGDLEEDFLQRIRKETALDSVQSALAASMADLDQMMMEEIDLDPQHRQQNMLQNNPSPALDVQARELKDGQYVTISREATSRRE